MESTPLDKIRDAIERATGPGRQTGDQWKFRCPAHPDREPSLGLTQNRDGHALLYCQAGCTTIEVLVAIGLDLRDLYPLRQNNRAQDPVIATYRYVDETGTLLFEVLRTAAKRFRQRRPDPAKEDAWLYNLDQTRRVLYRLPILPEAIRDGRTIYVVEGEKDVHTIEQLGQVATCNPGGAGKWRPEYTETLRGAHVVVVADRDEHGRGLAHARAVAFALQPVAASVTLVQPTVGKDTTDQVVAGIPLDEMTIVGIQAPAGVPDALPVAPVPVDDPNAAPVSPAGSLLDERRERIRITPATQFKIRAVQWVWQDRMPLGELCLIAGREGVGKSTFLAWLAAAVTNGNLPGVYHGEPRAVLYSANEDAWAYTIAPRMLAAGANLGLIYRIDVVEDDGPAGLNLPRDSRYLPEIAAEVKAAMLMCDPILSLVDSRINPNQSRELRTALEPLKAAAEIAGLAIPALVHFNKTRDVDLLSMMAGSRAWAEVARAALAIAEDRDADEYTCVVSQSKNNLGRSSLPHLTYTIDDVALETEEGPDAHVGRLRWTGETDIGAEEVLQRKPLKPVDDGPGRSVGDNIMDLLDDAGQAMNPTEIMRGLEQVGCTASYNNVKQRLHQLAKTGKIVKIGTGLYRMPEQVTTSELGEPKLTDNSDFHARAHAAARAGGPLETVTRNLPKSNNIRESYGESYVTEEGAGGSEGLEQTFGYGLRLRGGITPVTSPVTRACAVCFGPLTPIEEGQTTHPSCQ